MIAVNISYNGRVGYNIYQGLQKYYQPGFVVDNTRIPDIRLQLDGGHLAKDAAVITRPPHRGDWTLFANKSSWHMARKPPKSNWLPIGVDHEVFNPVIAPESREPKVLWIGSTGDYTHQNGIDEYVPCLKLLEAQLCRYGINFEMRNIDSNCEFYTQQDIANWYNTGTIFLILGKNDSASVSALEAASCGCIVVSSVIGNIPEFIKHGINGLLVSRDIYLVERAILLAMERYHSMLPHSLAMAKQYSWSNLSSSYYQLFKQVHDMRGLYGS